MCKNIHLCFVHGLDCFEEYGGVKDVIWPLAERLTYISALTVFPLWGSVILKCGICNNKRYGLHIECTMSHHKVNIHRKT